MDLVAGSEDSADYCMVWDWHYWHALWSLADSEWHDPYAALYDSITDKTGWNLKKEKVGNIGVEGQWVQRVYREGIIETRREMLGRKVTELTLQ